MRSSPVCFAINRDNKLGGSLGSASQHSTKTARGDRP